jgi:iron complex transport system substrate-binding protein
LGIPVVALELETPEQFSSGVAVLGQLFGNPQHSEEIESFCQAELDAVNKGVEGLTGEEQPSVLLLQYSETGGEVAFEVPPASYLQTIEVEMAGGVPVWKEASGGGGWNVVTLEQIAAWDPDVILVVDYSADSREVVAKLKTDAKWQALKAVQEGRLYGFASDFYSWDQPDPRWVLGVTWLATKLQPERFPDLNMQQEVTQFFGATYGMDAALVETQILPNLKGDIE